MAITVQQLKQYMEASKNILIAGEAGTGKTQMLKAAADELNLNMKYYSSSTLDPFADLVGIPVPNTITKLVEYYRPKEIDEAQVIFFDELNRADPKTINAVMEIIQFKSINGDPLVNLRCVVAAINPVDTGYNTEELDIAVRDRFDFFLTSEVVADYSYFKTKYGPTVARTAIDLFKDYQSSYKEDQRSKKNTLGYFSPRRLEKVLDAFLQFQTAEVIAASFPDDIIIAHKFWAQRLEEAIVGVKKININSDEAVANAKELIKLVPSELRKKQNQEPLLKTYSNLKALVAKQNQNKSSTIDGVVTPEGELPESSSLEEKLMYLKAAVAKQDKTKIVVTPQDMLAGIVVDEAVESNSSLEEKLMYKLRTGTASALNAGINTGRILEEYGPIVRDFDTNQTKTMEKNWQSSKVQNFETALGSYLRANPEVLVAEVADENDADAEMKSDVAAASQPMDNL